MSVAVNMPEDKPKESALDRIYKVTQIYGSLSGAGKGPKKESNNPAPESADAKVGSNSGDSAMSRRQKSLSYQQRGPNYIS